MPSLATLATLTDERRAELLDPARTAAVAADTSSLRYGQVAELITDMGPNAIVRVRGICTATGLEHMVLMRARGVIDWLRGAHIQDALPDLSKDEREFLLSGLSPEGWRQTFGDEDDEDAPQPGATEAADEDEHRSGAIEAADEPELEAAREAEREYWHDEDEEDFPF